MEFMKVVAAFNSAVGHPVESLPDGRIPIPEVTIKGRSEPTSATERLDSAPICLAVSLEFREVVIKAGVNHTVAVRDSTAQAIQILKITAVDFSTGGGERLGRCI